MIIKYLALKLSVVLCLMVPFYLNAQRKDGYQINGYVDGLTEGEKVVMSLAGPGSWEFHNRDSAYVKNGTFHLEGVVPEGPRLYFLLFGSHTSKAVRLLIDNNQDIRIKSGDINKIQHNYLENIVSIEGCPSTTTWNNLSPFDVYYFQQINAIDNYLKKIKDSIGFDRPLVDGLLTAKRIMTKMYYNIVLRDNPGVYDKDAIPFCVISSGLFDLSGHDAVIQDIYNDLGEEGRNSFDGKRLKQMTAFCIGKQLPEFVLPEVDGTMLSLKSIVSKSKLVLIHLWSSNGNPDLRSTYQQELRGFFKKYHAKGLNIIGISADSSAVEWKARVNAEEYPWYNVSDLKGREGIVTKFYQSRVIGGNASPDNLLLDGEGNIVAWFVNGAELQWYLWKYFGD